MAPAGGAGQLWPSFLCCEKPKKSSWRPGKGPQSRCGSQRVPTSGFHPGSLVGIPTRLTRCRPSAHGRGIQRTDSGPVLHAGEGRTPLLGHTCPWLKGSGDSGRTEQGQAGEGRGPMPVYPPNPPAARSMAWVQLHKRHVSPGAGQGTLVGQGRCHNHHSG